MNTYIALTIGPIYRTLKEARKTREIWAASYWFSYTMLKIVRKLKPYREKNEIEVYQPYQAFEQITRMTGVGIYPDRLIVKLKEGTFSFTQFEQIIKEVQNDLAGLIAQEKRLKKGQAEVLTELKQYLQFYYTEVEVPEDKNAILYVSKIMDTMELKNQFVADKGTEKLIFSKYLNLLDSRLYYIGFGKRFQSFPSIPEIATAEWKMDTYYQEQVKKYIIQKLRDENLQNNVSVSKETEKEEQDEREENSNGDNVEEPEPNERGSEDLKKGENGEDEFLKALKTSPNYKDKFRTYHKYVCIIHADGDNISKIIQSNWKNSNRYEAFKKFSNALNNFSAWAAQEAKAYGASVVYAGGDDLLCFAPLRCGDKHIFELLTKLDDEFKEKFGENVFPPPSADTPPPSMSFGMSITYYKYPLGEALQKSADNLFYRAKKTVSKNTLSLDVLKHSGQAFGVDFAMKNKSFDLFIELMNKIVAIPKPNEEEEKEDKMLQSLLHNLDAQEDTLGALMKTEKSDLKQRITYFFNQNYNEDVHTKETYVMYIQEVSAILYELMLEKSNIKEVNNTLSAMLSIIHFLKRKDNDQD